MLRSFMWLLTESNAITVSECLLVIFFILSMLVGLRVLFFVFVYHNKRTCEHRTRISRLRRNF